MIKKSLKSKSHRRLSGAECKLKRIIKDQFTNASDAAIDSLLPPKVEITVSKFPNRILVYSLEGGLPMFFDVDSRGMKIFPTVPELLPAFMLKGGEVSCFVIGGADLMFPGISTTPEAFPEFLAGEPWAVEVPGNPAPIAVGSTTMSSSEALKSGLRGKALKINHHYRDVLWESAEGRWVPNAGFFEDVVFGDPSLSSTCHGSDSLEGDASIDQEKDISNKEVREAIGDPVSDLNSASVTIAEQVSSGIGDLKLTENISTDQHVDEDQHTYSVEDVDAMLDKCLLQAFYTTVKDKDLPMAEVHYGRTMCYIVGLQAPCWILKNHHIKSCPSGYNLNPPEDCGPWKVGSRFEVIAGTCGRQTDVDSICKWMISPSENTDKYKLQLSVKEDKYTKEIMLRSVNRKHPDYTSFKPENQQVGKIEQPVDGATNGVVSKMLEIVVMYKPGPHVDPIFTSVGADPKQFYSAVEAIDIVLSYVEKENLVKPLDGSFVALDGYLCDALFKESTKNGSTYPTSIHMKDLGAAFINQTQAHHQVTRGTQSIVRKGFLKPIRIIRERRLGHKKMMRLSGLESFLIDAKPLSSELQKKFGCSTTVVEFPGKKGVEILVLCGMSGGLARFLVKRYQIPQRYIEVFDKTKK